MDSRIKQINIQGVVYDIQAKYDDLGNIISDSYVRLGSGLTSLAIVTGYYDTNLHKFIDSSTGKPVEDIKPGILYIDVTTSTNYVETNNLLVSLSSDNQWNEVN